MKARCYNPRRKEYKNYGGRGITVCIGWLSFKPFENFYDHPHVSGHICTDAFESLEQMEEEITKLMES